MATIPVYQYPQVSLDPSAVGRARRDVSGVSAASGVQEGAALARIGEQVTDFLIRQQRVKDTAGVRETLVQARSEVDRFLFGDGAQKGLYNNLGKDAADSYAMAASRFSDIYKQYSDTLPSAMAKEMFDASFLPFVAENQRSVLRHQADQIQAYKNDTLDAYNQQLVETAINNRNTPSIIIESEEAITANTRERFKGMEGPAVEAQISKRIYDLYTSVLNAVVDDNPMAAVGFFKKHEAKFDPRIRETLRAKIEDKARLFESYEIAKELATSGLPFEAQLAEVDKMTDIKMALEVRKAVRDRHTEALAIEADMRRKAELNTWLSLKRDPNAPIPYSQLDDAQWRSMEQYRNTRLSNFAEVTDWDLMGRLSSLSVIQLRDMGMEKLLTYRTKLEEKHWNIIMQQYINGVNAAAAQAQKGAVLTQIATARALIEDTVKAIDYSDEQKSNLTRTVQVALEEFETLNGRKADSSEIQKLIDRAVLEVDVSVPFWFDPTKPYFEAKQEVETIGRRIYLGDISDKDLELVIQALEARNIPVTRENILNLYKKVK